MIRAPFLPPPVRQPPHRVARSRPAPATATWTTISRSEPAIFLHSCLRIGQADAAAGGRLDGDAPGDPRSELNLTVERQMEILVTSISSGPCSRGFGWGVSDVAFPAVGRRSGHPP